MQQAGGINRRGALAFDAKATAFGAYDAALIAAVQQTWYNLLDEHMGAHRTGKVVVEFRLTYAGKVVNDRITENDVGEILGQFCHTAITQPAPYGEWPPDMRRAIGGNYRDVKFTLLFLNAGLIQTNCMKPSSSLLSSSRQSSVSLSSSNADSPCVNGK
jgi:hypothetical protein